MDNDDLLKSLNVLYAEDDPIVRLHLGRFLRRRFKEVFEAENGLDGLEFYKANHPEVVITDIEMPVMDGIEMVRRIRLMDGGQPLIIVTTGYDDDEHKLDEVCANLLKPINQGHLIEIILDCLGHENTATGGAG